MTEKKGIWIALLVVILTVPVVYLLLKHHVKTHSKDTSEMINFNVTVSQRDDGQFRTISEAIAAAPAENPVPFFIRVRSGIYNEVVVVTVEKKNVVLVGDGSLVTKITAGKHTPDFPTPETATFSVYGDGFMAQGITFENTAGSETGPAVALLCSSNYAIFYKCSFIGYHDTLYAKEGKQFYRECDIFGTVDFIFGFAAAVFQKCNLYARSPDYQTVTYTAQGRQSLEQQSGFTLQGCQVTVSPEVDLTSRSTISGFLGRPWFPFSTVMVMESYLDSVVSPSGWVEWPDTPATSAIYLEFKNSGPGSDTSRRVRWPGYRVIHDADQARAYTASRLIQGDEWIPQTGVPYDGGFLT